jgi:hypothetical protein
MEGRKWNHIKKCFWSWSVFLLSKYWLPLSFQETLGTFFFYAPSLEDLGVRWYLRRKSLHQKLLFKWLHYIGDGRIFRNGVMHANMAKSWLWRCGSCGYIGSGCIVQSGGMHAKISMWSWQLMWVANHFQKKFKTEMDTSLNKAQHKQELLRG